MKKKPLFIAFSSQKGGVGKSTFTALAASYLHYTLRYNVMVVDCDYPQTSLHSLRKREVEMVRQNEYYRNKAVALCNSIDKQPFRIITAKPEDAITTAYSFLGESTESYDVVFFDMAGTINNNGMVATYLMLDYVFAPMLASRMVLESTLTFITATKEYQKANPDIHLKEIYLFWNRIDGRVKRDTIVAYEEVISALELKRLKTEIPQSVRFDREQSLHIKDGVFLSTLFPPDKHLLQGSNLDLLIEEIVSVTGLKTSGDERGE